MALNDYQQELQRLLADKQMQRWNLADLANFVNKARRRIAIATRAVRVLPPSTGSLASIGVNTGGSGYTAPVVTISAPDGYGTPSQPVQATATATVVGGAITAIALGNAGTGYVATPTVTIADPTGSGAAVTPVLTPFVSTIAGQEVYTFSSINSIIQANFPGVNAIEAIQGISVSWGGWKPTLRYESWSAFQALYRAWNVGSQNYPEVWSQYGQGENGSFYLWSIPATLNQMDLDCYCTPIDLVTDADVEAIPHPFTEAVPYYAAYWAYMSAQNGDMAATMYANYKRTILEARSFAQPDIVPSFYQTGL